MGLLLGFSYHRIHSHISFCYTNKWVV